jgi:hypothetical protein
MNNPLSVTGDAVILGAVISRWVSVEALLHHLVQDRRCALIGDGIPQVSQLVLAAHQFATTISTLPSRLRSPIAIDVGAYPPELYVTGRKGAVLGFVVLALKGAAPLRMGGILDFPNGCPVPFVCARAARAMITVRTAMNRAIQRRMLALRENLRVMGDLRCQGIRALGRLRIDICLGAEPSAQNHATASGERPQV